MVKSQQVTLSHVIDAVPGMYRGQYLFAANDPQPTPHQPNRGRAERAPVQADQRFAFSVEALYGRAA